MGEKLRKSDISEPNLFGDLVQSAKALEDQLKETNTELNKSTKVIIEAANKADAMSQKGINNLIKMQKLMEANFKRAQTIDREKIKTTKLLSSAKNQQAAEDRRIAGEKRKIDKEKEAANRRAIADGKRLRADQEKAAKLAQKTRRATLDNANAYKTLSKNVNSASARLKRMAAQYGATDKRTIRAQKNFDRLEKKLRGVNNAARDGRRDVGRYGTALNGVKGSALKMAAALGLMGGGLAIFRSVFTTIKNFEQGQADLASVLGTNVDGMKALTDQAKQLGATTTFTATEVSELQKEFAKLGFTQSEIENVTEATLLLAEATGTELADAASVTGSTLRAFGLESKDTQRVVDVMAASFSKSSLDMSKFSTAMATVAPVAKTMGLSIEETTALIGTLTDNGIEASTAGTGLRNMMLNAKKAGLTLDEALDKIANSSDKVGTSFDLFGQRGATLGVVLSSSSDKTDKLTESLENADGSAKAMAETQRDTLGGALKLLGSAWDGFILSMNESGGVADKLKSAIVFLADNLETIIGVVGVAVKTFIAYKGSIMAANAASRLWAAGTKIATVAQALFTGGIKGARVAMKSLNLTMKANPIGAIIGVITAVVSVFSLWNKELTDAQKETKKLAEEQKVLEANMADDRAELAKNTAGFQIYIARLRETNAGSKERSKLITEINDKYGTTLTNMASEIGFQNQLNLAVDEYIKLQKNKILLKRNEAEITTQLNLQIEAEENIARLRQEIEESRRSGETWQEASRRWGLSVDDIRRYQAQLDAANLALEGLGLEALNLNNVVIDPLVVPPPIITTGGSASTSSAPAPEVSLIEKITDERIKGIKDRETRESTILRLAASRRIKKLKGNEQEVALLTEEIIKNRDAELIVLAKKFEDERLKVKTDAQAVIDAQILQDQEDEKAQILKSRKDTLDDFKLLLLTSKKSEAEINKEFLEFEIEQLEKRTDLTIEEKINLQEKIRELNKEDLGKVEEDQAKKLRDELKKIGVETLNELTKISQQKQALIDDEISKSKELEDRLRDGAKNGNAIATESLAEQESITEEKTRQKQREAKKEALLEEAKAIWNALNNFLDQGDKLPVAGAKAIGGVLGIKTLVNGLTGFFKGTKGRLKDEHKAQVSGKDGHVVRVDGNEAILTGSKMDKLAAAGLTTTDDIVNSAILNQQLIGIPMANAIDDRLVGTDNSAMEKKLDTLIDISKNNKPTSMHPVFKRGLIHAISEAEKKNGKITRNWTYK